MVGSAIARRFEADGFERIITRSSQELDLRDQLAVNPFFENERPDFVFLAAARAGGILANDSYPTDFLYDHMMIAENISYASYRHGVHKLLNLGSSCIYPKHAPQPLKEEYLLTGPLEPTNRAYAIAKIMAIELCDGYRRQHGRDFISAMPTNLYGPFDNFDLNTSHVLPALLRKIHEATAQGHRSVEVWGSGRPLREFLHVDDLADACLFMMNHVSEPGPINVGTGHDISILSLAELIAEIVGYNGEFVFDTTKPDGTPRKLMDVSRLNTLGWKATIDLRQGIQSTYQWYIRTHMQVKG